MDIFLAHNQVIDPHQVLGIQGDRIRVYRPDAPDLFFELKGSVKQMEKMGEEGLFEYPVGEGVTRLDYKVYHKSGLLDYDPYAFDPVWSEEDGTLFSQGEHGDLGRVMGGRLTSHQGVLGCRFVVWAPNAHVVSVIADFNHWDGRVNPMRRIGEVWELFVPGLVECEKYKFEIRDEEGHYRVKSDPFALGGELRPKNASVIRDVGRFEWSDGAWMEARRKVPLNVYEMHLGSWKRGDQEFYNYRELAPMVAEYVKEMGYTHVEVLPLTEHPLDESWGYQVSGYFAITSRYGTPEDFQFFVNYLHNHDVGVILDWVPGHFPRDDFSFARFDGTCLFEHEDPKQGLHPTWDTMIFNYGRNEVRNFLLASALFLIETYHLDGIRVDAVDSMVNLNFHKKEGEWIPNKDGGVENYEAIAFLKELNRQIHARLPGVVTFAEDSSMTPNVTGDHGLGFDRRWNIGWMSDTLEYLKTKQEFRVHEMKTLMQSFGYAFVEKFILTLSHDEVVHEQKSLFSKMPERPFDNVKLLLSFQICYPGQNLLFMGGEFGQIEEWNCKGTLQWELLEKEEHADLHRFVKALNHFFLAHPPLWGEDFEWVETDSDFLAYRRGELLIAHNFGNAPHPHLEGKPIFNSHNPECIEPYATAVYE